MGPVLEAPTKVAMVQSMVFLLVFGVFCGIRAEEDCDTIHTDKCGILIWPFLVDTTKAPADEAEKAESCKEIREGYKCTADYLARCPNVIKKENAEDLLESIEITINDFCDGPLGKRYLPHGACLKANLGKNFTCNTDSVTTLEKVVVYEPIEDRLKLACCAYLQFDKCFKDASTTACDRRAARAIRNLVQSYAIFMVEKCVGFLAGPDRCNLDSLKGLTAGKDRKPISVFPALMDIISTTF